MLYHTLFCAERLYFRKTWTFRSPCAGAMSVDASGKFAYRMKYIIIITDAVADECSRVLNIRQHHYRISNDESTGRSRCRGKPHGSRIFMTIFACALAQISFSRTQIYEKSNRLLNVFSLIHSFSLSLSFFYLQVSIACSLFKWFLRAKNKIQQRKKNFCTDNVSKYYNNVVCSVLVATATATALVAAAP